MVDNNVNVNTKDPLDDKTPLHFTSIVGNVDYLKALLDQGAEIDAVDKFGNTPFLIGASNSRLSIVQELFKREASIRPNNDGEDAISLCSNAEESEEKTETLNFLIENVGYQLCIEKISDSNEIISFIDKYPILVKKFGSMLIFNAVTYEKDDLIEHLLNIGVDPNSRDISEFTPLHQSAFDDRPNIVKLLLKNGADANAQTSKGITPLHIAADNINVKIVKILARNDAELIPNSSGETAFDIIKKKKESGSRGVNEIIKWLSLLQNRDLCVKCMLSIDFFKQQLKLNPDVYRLFGTSLLMKGIEKKNTEIVDELLKLGVSVNKQDCKGRYPLHLAINLRDEAMVDHLLNNGSSPHIKDKKGRSAILNAALTGSPGIIKLVLKRNVEYTYDKEGNSPYDLILKSDNEDKDEALKIITDCALKIAYKKMSDTENFIDFVNKNSFLIKNNGLNLLEYASRKGRDGVIDFLIENKISPNQRIENNGTLLHKAAKEGKYELAKNLISKGAIIGLVDDNKATPLHYAASNGSLKIVHLLIKNGATLRKDKEGKTPLDYTTDSDIINEFNTLTDYMSDMSQALTYDQFKDVFKNYRMKFAVHSCVYAILFSSKRHVEYMLDRGLNVNACNEKGVSLLHFAIPDHLEIAQLLLDRGANVNSTSDCGCTPLHFACKYNGSKEVISYLIEKGANVNATTSNGITPLFYAAKKSSLHAVELLLENGANPNARTKNDILPLDIAVNKKNQQIIDLLVEKGADKISLEQERIDFLSEKFITSTTDKE